MFERFTRDAREVVTRAQSEARRLRHGWIGTEHLLLGLVAGTETVAGGVIASFGVTHAWVRSEIERIVASGAGPGDAAALATLGIDLEEVRRRVEEAFGSGALDRGLPSCGPRGGGHLPFSRGAKKALELSLREALALKHGYIGTEHVLLGVLREGHGVAARILASRGVTHAGAKAAILARLADEAS